MSERSVGTLAQGHTTGEPVFVSIYTDGMGTYQARCLGCAYRGAWWRTEKRAVKDAQDHTDHVVSAQ